MSVNQTPTFPDYRLLDSGEGEKLESWSGYVTRRPEPQAVWRKSLSEKQWRDAADASFLREERSEERGEWKIKHKAPTPHIITYNYKEMKLRMRIGLTSFKHVGIFPEQAANWNFIFDSCKELQKTQTEPVKILNLFAYTGGATLAARSAGAQVTHVDSVKQVVTWAKENMELSGLRDIRWIVEDAVKFVEREVRRGNKYHGIILDPPAYGRGANGERWILEESITPLLELCAQLLDGKGSFLIMSLYSMGLSQTIARTTFRSAVATPSQESSGELYFADDNGKELPLGTYYRATL